MARDSSGNYTLPPGNPVTSGTIIEADWANDTMADVAQALTDSFSRIGQGGMLSPFKNADGSAAAPGDSWTNEPTSGWYRKTTNEFWFVVGTDEVFGVTKAGIQMGTGKLALNIASVVTVQDAEPDTPKNGAEWFKSNNGALYMRYQNPDLSFTWVQVNAAGGNWLPAQSLHLVLPDFASDAAAGAAGVPIGVAYRTGNEVRVRIT